jgi:hypothetical protein
MAAWFTYRVYRHLTDAADDAPIAGPDDPVIREIGAQLAADQSVVGSLRRYEGRDLVSFGEWTAPSGYQYSGASKRTIAYRRASSLLCERLGLEATPRGAERDAPEAQGCLTCAVLTAAGIAAAWLAIASR